MTAPEREALVKALLPCPFCGGKAEHKLIETYSCDSSYYVVRCEDCQAMIHADDELSASDVKAWNARVSRPAAPAVTVTEERVTRAAETLSNYTVSDRFPRSERDAALEEAAALAEAWSPFVKEKWRAGEINHAEFAANHGAALTIGRKIRALKSTTPQTGSQE